MMIKEERVMNIIYVLLFKDAKPNIIPLDYNKIKLAKMWNGKISYKNNKLKSSIYSSDTLIFHYGNPNFNHPAIVSAMVDLGVKRQKFFD